MTSKKPVLFVLLFAMYHFLVHLILGVHEFYVTPFSALGIITIQAGTVFVFQLCFQFVLQKRNNKNTVLLSSSYTISSILVSVLLFLFFTIFKEYYLSFFAAFLLTGTVYSLFDFSLRFFNSLTQNSSSLSLVSQTEVNKTEESKLFSLTDSRGKNRLSIPLKSIICFEANDNYVTIYFEDEGGKMIKKLERISMKRIEEFLGNENKDFLRIHKSFIINTNFILQVVGKSQAQKVQLKHLIKELPVSRKINISDYLT